MKLTFGQKRVAKMLDYWPQWDDQYRHQTGHMVEFRQELETAACQLNDELAAFKDRPRRSVTVVEQGFGNCRERADPDRKVGG